MNSLPGRGGAGRAADQSGRTRRFISPNSKAKPCCLRSSTPDALCQPFARLISSEFATIHKELAKNPAELRKTHLLSISLDPTYDTPPVLRKYGWPICKTIAAGFGHWDFVSTTPADLQNLAAAFGLEYFEQNNQISHSMNTVLLARDGTVAKSWPGNEWKTSDVIAALRQAISTKSTTKG